jgi:sialate O-acetylesterase
MRERLGIVAIFSACAVFATVKPAGVFTDGMVLQQGEPVCIWGTAPIAEKVTVQFAGQTQRALSDTNGRWQVELNPLPASSEPRALVCFSSDGSQQSFISNVVVGEVWLAGGQSNMETTMADYKQSTQSDISSANDPLLRMITIPSQCYEGQNDARPQWKQSTSKNISGFSASAYYFAKNLREVLQVPVGIISCAVGGTPAEAWMSREMLESSPDLKRILDTYETYHEKYHDDVAFFKKCDEYNRAMKAWSLKREAGENPGRRPPEPNGLFKNRPCGLYENMLTQAIPYTMKGVIWYQGECNANQQNGHFYRTVFATLIEGWRRDFQNPELPFIFVQLATFDEAHANEPYWPELRESQCWVNKHVDNTGMAVLVDGGESHSIHPHSKDKVGERLSLLARNMVYGENDLVCCGPRLHAVIPKEKTLELIFDTEPVLKQAPESGFEIAGEDGEYVTAKAEMDNGKIIVSAESIPEPKSVRYGWKKWFIPAVFNKKGLPSSPFRTDDFTPVTTGRYYMDRL